MNYYVIDDVKTKVYSIFGSSYKKMPNAPAIVAVSDYNKKNVENGREFTTDGIVSSTLTAILNVLLLLTAVSMQTALSASGRARLNGEIVGWKEVEAYEPAEGMHFAWYHDNGYSYLGVDPAKKEDWIAAVRKIKKVWYGNLYGIVYLENGVIDVRQCSKRYSEVSNT